MEQEVDLWNVHSIQDFGAYPIKYVKDAASHTSGWTDIRCFTGGHSSENHWRLCKRPRRTYPSPSYRSPQADHRRPSQF